MVNSLSALVVTSTSGIERIKRSKNPSFSAYTLTYTHDGRRFQEVRIFDAEVLRRFVLYQREVVWEVHMWSDGKVWG